MSVRRRTGSRISRQSGATAASPGDLPESPISSASIDARCQMDRERRQFAAQFRQIEAALRQDMRALRNTLERQRLRPDPPPPPALSDPSASDLARAAMTAAGRQTDRAMVDTQAIVNQAMRHLPMEREQSLRRNRGEGSRHSGDETVLQS
jgi:hypothetical protein